jgi:hypothetical protein
VDAAVFGRDAAFEGSGVLARVSFRVKGEGDPRIRLASVEARDVRNHPVSLGAPGPVAPAIVPSVMALAPSYPNPFTRATTVVLGLPQASVVRLAVFDVQGRLMRTLTDGPVPAGWTRVTWDGLDAGGVRVAPGAYVFRMSVEGRVLTKSVRLVR